MLAGQPPFGGPTADSVVRQHLTTTPPSVDVIRPSVPTPVATALDRALAKTPADRFGTAAEFAAALGADSVSTAGRPTRAGNPVAGRVGTLAGTIGVVAVAAFAAHQFLTVGADPGPPPADRPYTVLAAAEGSADPEIRDNFEFLLRNALDAAHVVQTVPDPQVRRLLRLMERPETEALDPVTARELAERAGVNTVVLPRIDAVGKGFVVAVRVEDAATGHLLAEADGQAIEPDQVVATVTRCPWICAGALEKPGQHWRIPIRFRSCLPRRWRRCGSTGRGGLFTPTSNPGAQYHCWKRHWCWTPSSAKRTRPWPEHTTTSVIQELNWKIFGRQCRTRSDSGRIRRKLNPA